MRDERGQILPFMVLGLLVALVGIGGLVVDVGQAYWAKRQLQAATDAAALAAAQDLPDTVAVQELADRYGPNGANPIRGATNVTATVATRCLVRTPGCSLPNTVVVSTRAEVKTVFARVFGLDTFNVATRATACSPCGSRPLDIMFVLDRTGSMCDGPGGACIDLKNAQDGMRSFLQLMNPSADRVGLAVLPPAPSVAQRCSAPVGYESRTGQYVVVPLSDDYLLADGQLNPSSDLVSTIGCIKGQGSTSYATALQLAQDELARDGRPRVQKVIIFLSDGAANDGPPDWTEVELPPPWGTYWMPNLDVPARTQPCHTGVATGAAIQDADTVVYSIGYDVGDGGNSSQVCLNTNTGDPEAPDITAYDALQQIASPGNFYVKPDPGQLKTIFGQIAADIAAGTSKLVSDDS